MDCSILSLSLVPGREQLQARDLTLLHSEAHAEEAVHRLGTIGVHMLPIVEEELIDPQGALEVEECASSPAATSTPNSTGRQGSDRPLRTTSVQE